MQRDAKLPISIYHHTVCHQRLLLALSPIETWLLTRDGVAHRDVLQRHTVEHPCIASKYHLVAQAIGLLDGVEAYLKRRSLVFFHTHIGRCAVLLQAQSEVAIQRGCRQHHLCSKGAKLIGSYRQAIHFLPIDIQQQQFVSIVRLHLCFPTLLVVEHTFYINGLPRAIERPIRQQERLHFLTLLMTCLTVIAVQIHMLEGQSPIVSLCQAIGIHTLISWQLVDVFSFSVCEELCYLLSIISIASEQGHLHSLHRMASLSIDGGKFVLSFS